MRKLLIFNILITLTVSCQTKETSQSGTLIKPFYDIKGFFNDEIKRLTEGGMTIQKTVTVNGKTETQVIEKPNFEEEFKMFIASDINRPAWGDKYFVKETPVGNHGSKKEYWSKDKILRTKKVIVEEMYGNVNKTIEILNSDKSVVTETDAHLYYDINSGYRISTYQKLVGSVDSVSIDVKFLKRLN